MDAEVHKTFVKGEICHTLVHKNVHLNPSGGYERPFQKYGKGRGTHWGHGVACTHNRMRKSCGINFMRWEIQVSDMYVCLKNQHGGCWCRGKPITPKVGEAVRNDDPCNFRPLYKQFV